VTRAAHKDATDTEKLSLTLVDTIKPKISGMQNLPRPTQEMAQATPWGKVEHNIEDEKGTTGAGKHNDTERKVCRVARGSSKQLSVNKEVSSETSPQKQRRNAVKQHGGNSLAIMCLTEGLPRIRQRRQQPHRQKKRLESGRKNAGSTEKVSA